MRLEKVFPVCAVMEDANDKHLLFGHPIKDVVCLEYQEANMRSHIGSLRPDEGRFHKPAQSGPKLAGVVVCLAEAKMRDAVQKEVVDLALSARRDLKPPHLWQCRQPTPGFWPETCALPRRKFRRGSCC